MPGIARRACDERFGVLHILGCNVHRITAPEVANLFCEWIESGDRRPRFVINTGFHGLWVAHQDPDFKAIVDGVDLFTPDGAATSLLAKVQGCPLKGRARGIDLMREFFQLASARSYRSYFYGDTEQTLANLELALTVRYPGHIVAGTEAPPFRALSKEESAAAVKRINAAKPDVLWVGLGLPKQERWVAEVIEQLEVPVVIGVGACFRFYSGDLEQAPRWMVNTGLEWAWRLAAEPRKLWRRDLIDGPRFLAVALTDALHERRQRRRQGADGRYPV